MKVIKVESCSDCPLCKDCKVWKKLTSKQRVTLSIGHGVPHKFILNGCPLEDDPSIDTIKVGVL